MCSNGGHEGCRGSPEEAAKRGRAGFLEEGQVELNLKGKFGSSKWPRG